MLRKPIFISGLRKSGTSMTRQLLDGHPELFVTPWNEFHFFKFTHYDHVLTQTAGVRKPIQDRVEDICNDRWFNPRPKVDKNGELVERRSVKDFDRFKETLRARAPGIVDYKGLFEAIVESMADATRTCQGPGLDHVRCVCKGVQQTEFFPELAEWFPDLKFVYVLRNPYGQLNSAINNMRHNTTDVRRKYDIARDHRKLSRKLPYPFLGRRLREMRLSYYFAGKFADLRPRNFRILVYDRLLESPEQEMRALAEFLEIEFDPCLLRLSQQGKPRQRRGWSVQRYGDDEISKKPLTAWKTQLAPGAIHLVNVYFPDIIRDYGFELEDRRPHRWRRFDRSERPLTYVANRFLFSRHCRRIVPGVCRE